MAKNSCFDARAQILTNIAKLTVRKSLIDPYEQFLDKKKPNYLKMVCFFAKNLFYRPFFRSKFQQKITKKHRIRAYDFVPCRDVPYSGNIARFPTLWQLELWTKPLLKFQPSSSVKKCRSAPSAQKSTQNP